MLWSSWVKRVNASQNTGRRPAFWWQGTWYRRRRPTDGSYKICTIIAWPPGSIKTSQTWTTTIATYNTQSCYSGAKNFYKKICVPRRGKICTFHRPFQEKLSLQKEVQCQLTIVLEWYLPPPASILTPHCRLHFNEPYFFHEIPVSITTHFPNTTDIKSHIKPILEKPDPTSLLLWMGDSQFLGTVLVFEWN